MIREKFLKFEAEGREFSKILRSLEQFIAFSPEKIKRGNFISYFHYLIKKTFFQVFKINKLGISIFENDTLFLLFSAIILDVCMRLQIQDLDISSFVLSAGVLIRTIMKQFQ